VLKERGWTGKNPHQL